MYPKRVFFNFYILNHWIMYSNSLKRPISLPTVLEFLLVFILVS